MKKKLLLALMALLPLAVFAADLDVSKFTAANINYGATALGAVNQTQGLTVGDDYVVETTKFYTSDTGAGETAIGAGGATLAATNAGTYYMKVTGAGAYVGQTIYVSFHINPIAVTIDFNGGQAKTFGDPDPANFTYTLSALNAATLGLTVGREAGENVKGGGYAFTFKWTNTNVELTRAGGDTDVFTINAKNIAGTAVITAEQGNVVYTGKNIIGVYTVKDKADGVVLTAGKDYNVDPVKNVAANYKPNIVFAGNYSGTINPATGFAVTKAPITVSVNNIEVDFDNTDQKDQTAAAVFNYSGFVGDDIAPATKDGIIATFTAPTSVQATTTAKNAGTYTLKVTGGTAAGNYEFKNYLDGNLTINKLDLTIKANGAAINLGDADPASYTLDATALGATLGEVVTGVTFTCTHAAAVGSYDIVPNTSAAVVKIGGTDVTANYNLTIADPKGQLVIGKGGIVVTIKDAEKLYGETDPAFEYVVSGLQEGDELAAFTITRTVGENAGAYSMTATVTNPNPEKYATLTVVPGIFTINKARLLFTIPAQNLAIGKTAADLSALCKPAITVSGINNKDVASTLYNIAFSAGVSTDGGDPAKTDINQTVPAGIEATLTGAAAANYVIVDADDVEQANATGKLIVGTGGGAGVTFTSVNADYTTIQNRAGETVPTVALTLNNRNGRKVPASTTHTWAAETWNTMVLPFEVTVAELSAQLGYAIVNVVDKDATTEGNVQFKLEMQTIPANTPFCVKTSAAIADGTVLNFVNKLIVDGGENPSVDAGMGYKFVGAYKNKTIDKNNPTYNFLRGDNDKWAHIGATSSNTWTVVPFDAYVELTEAAAARGVTFTFEEFDGTATVIKAVDAEEAESAQGTAAEGWYTINGIKLNAKPTQKGIYIYNGKKVAVQ